MSARELITEHFGLWTGAVKKKSSSGRGSNGKVELTGIKKLRELILNLAVRGKLVPQNSEEPSAASLLVDIEAKKEDLHHAKTIKKPKKVSPPQGDEIPWTLPSCWEWVRLPDIYYPISPSGKKLKSSETLETGQFPVVDQGQSYISGYTDDASLVIEIPHPLIVFGDHTTARKYIDFNFVPGADGTKILCPILVNPRFFYLQLLGYDLENRGYARHFKVLNENFFALPPLEEQHRIVQKVDELMALCDRLEQQTSDQLEAHETLVDTLLGSLLRNAEGSLTPSENATELADNWARLAAHFDTLFTTEQSIDKLKQTILQLAVMGRLVEQDAGDEPATEALKRIQAGKDQLSQSSKQRKAKPLPPIAESEEPFSLPSGWTLSRLDDITDIQGGIAKGKKVSGKKTRTLPYLRVANVQRSSLNLSEIKEIEIAEDEVERYLVCRRDLLITEGGDWDKVGRTAIWDGCIEPMAHQNHVFRARLIMAEQNERWLERYLNSQFARDYFAGSSKQTTNLASINKTQLRSCTVPLPPLAEQHRIVQKVDELMALCDQLKERLNQASETRCQLAEAVVEGALN